MALRHEYAPVSRFVARGTGKDREFCEKRSSFSLSVAGRAAVWRSTISGPLSACTSSTWPRWRNALSALKHSRTAGSNASSWGTKQGTAPHRRSLWRWPGENPSAIVGSSADNSSSSVRDGGSPRRAGDDVIYLALHQSPQRGAFTLLLKRNAGMLLLASAADAKMGAARRLALRAVGQSAFHLSAGVLFFIFHQHHLGLLVGQHAAHEQRLPLVAGNTLTKGIEVVDCNEVYDLARRHTPFCRVNCAIVGVVSIK